MYVNIMSSYDNTEIITYNNTEHIEIKLIIIILNIAK